MRLFQIVPRLPPSICGLGDYACSLGVEFRNRGGAETVFVVGEPNWRGAETVCGSPVLRLPHRASNDLADSLDFYSNTSDAQSSAVLLHYVNYGYAKRGCPFWLLEGCRKWRSRSKDNRLIVVFHELYATGPVWSSPFWLSGIQIHLAKSLYQLCSGAITSNTKYADELKRWDSSKPVVAMPVFSNIGDPESVQPLSERPRRAVVFGGRENRRRVYEQSMPALEWACKAFDLTEVLDVGPTLSLTINKIGSANLMQCGERTREEISALLQQSRVGFFDYASEFWAKSGIFAAYCSHGVVPVSARKLNVDMDGVAQDMYISANHGNTEKVDLTTAEKVAGNAREWYLKHSRKASAKRIEDLIWS